MRSRATGVLGLAATAAVMAAIPAAADASTKLTLSAQQKVVKKGHTHTVGGTKVLSGEVDRGTFKGNGGASGSFVTLLTRRTTSHGVSYSGTSAAAFSSEHRTLCLPFKASARDAGSKAKGKFSGLVGTGTAADSHGSGEYTRSRKSGSLRTKATGKVSTAAAGHVGATCRKAIGKATSALPSVDIAAAGDISCPGGDAPTPGSCQQRATPDLLLGPLDAVFALGDTQYNDGAFEFYTLGSNAFDDTWGRVKRRIYPTVGNHEYRDPAGGASGYFRYFASGAARDPGKPGEGWYSFDLGGWHILSLNANCGVTPGDLGASACAAGSAQESFVRSDLAANAKSAVGGPRCILAFWHEPLYSSHRDQQNPLMRPIWQDLMNAHADLVLSGHQHSYERFAPQDTVGNATPAGIPQFVVGTGGEDHGNIDEPVAPNTVVENHNTFGVLTLKLGPGRYDWRFASIAGSTSGFGDSGHQSCH